MNGKVSKLLNIFAAITNSNAHRIKKNFLNMTPKQQSIALLEIKKRLKL